MYSLSEKEQVLGSQTKALLLRCRSVVQAAYPNAEIILYGSQARGQAQPESDIDLLVLLDEEVPAAAKRRIHDLLYDVALAEDVVISSIIKSSRKWHLPFSHATPALPDYPRRGDQGRMTGNHADLIRYRLNRAKETLEEPQIMFDNGCLYGAANRIYYACFYAVVGLLLTKNLSSSKHSGTIGLFNKHFVKTEEISVYLGSFTHACSIIAWRAITGSLLISRQMKSGKI
jgi:uncharacterized protein (UPF0332 family)/predicted nucleotidyltransferase